MKNLFLFVVMSVMSVLLVGCATAPSGGQRGVVTVVNRSDTMHTTVTNGVTNVVSTANISSQGFLKPHRQWSVMGLIFGEKDPIPTAVPGVQNTQQEPVVIVQPVASPYGAYPYGYGYPYGYPYRSVYYGGGGERRLFGVRFHAR